MIFNALVYEGSLAIAALFFYFYVEPKYNNSEYFIDWRGFKEKRKFLIQLCSKLPKGKYWIEGFKVSNSMIFSLLLGLPFMEFFVGFMLQSNACKAISSYSQIFETPSKFLCVAVPDLFSHSLYYDIFFLRVNDTVNGAHWIDYMFLPAIFIFTYHLTRDPFFSALNSAFMVFYHEVIWFAFYWFKYYTAYQYEGWFNDFAFFLLVCTFGVIGFVKYRDYFLTKRFFGVSTAYILFLVYWYLKDNFEVTVINNTHLGDSLKFLITQWYYLPIPNQDEVISWVIIFSGFLLNVWLVSRSKKVESIKQSVLV